MTEKEDTATDEAAFLRGHNLRILAEKNEPGWVDVCLDAALDDPHGFVRGEGAYALTDAPEVEVVPKLARALGATEPAVRFRALRLLTRRKPDLVLDVLEDELTTNDIHRRRRSVEALGKLGSVGVEALQKASKDPDPSIRSRSAKGLASTGAASAVPALVELLKDPVQKVHLAAVRALIRLSDRPELGKVARAASEGIAHLCNTTRDPSVRKQCLIAASRLYEGTEASRFLEAMDAGDNTDQDLVAGKADLLARGRSWERLNEMLGQGNTGSALAAASALSTAHGAPLSLLSGLVADANPVVRACGARGLGAASEDPQARQILRKAASDPDPGVRWVARRALTGRLSKHARTTHLEREAAKGPSASWPFGLARTAPSAKSKRLPFAVAAVNLSYNLNLGVLIRSAEGAGAREMLIAGREYYHRLAAMGADRHLAPKVFETHQAMTLYARSQGYQLVAVQQSPGAERFDEADYPPSPCLVLGSEGQGLPPQVCAQADLVVYIPQPGRIDSINVTAAASIVMWTCLSKRGWLERSAHI